MLDLSKALALALVVGMGPVVAFSDEPGTPPFDVSDVNTVVPGHPGITYFDLLAQLVPDLDADETMASGHDIARIRHIRGSEFSGNVPDMIQIGSIWARPYQAEGQPLILLLAYTGGTDDFAEAPTVLVAFRDVNPPVLLDAVDVGMGRFTGFDVSATISIGKGDQAIVTSSQHFNSNENHAIDALIFMRNGKFELIDTFSLYGVRGCGFEQWQSLSVENGAPKNPGPYDDIKVTVTDAREMIDDACDEPHIDRAFSHAVTALYQWDAGRNAFVADSDAIKRLEKEAAARF